MNNIVLMTFDLPGAESAARTTFYSEMKKRKWNRWSNTTTTLYTSYNGHELKDVKLDIILDVIYCSAFAGISKWSLICQVGNIKIYTANSDSLFLTILY